MFKTKQIKLFKIFGVEINADYSWFWIFLLVSWSFGRSLSLFMPEQDLITYIVFGFVTSLLFFLSVVIHELAHTLVGRANNIPINKITLFIFGGASNLTKEPDSAIVELKMASAGPIASIIIGILLLGISLLFRSDKLIIYFFLTQTLGAVNLILAAFNLLPGFPLDGGRVLRALIWLKIKDFLKSTYYASISGKIIAIIIGIAGLAQTLFLGTFGGLWLVLIGFFLFQAADASYNYSRIITRLNNFKAKRFVAKENLFKIQTTLSLEDIAGQILQLERKYLPIYKGDEVVGIISTNNLEDVQNADWSEVEVGMIMTPLEYLPEIQGNQKATAILQCFEEKETDVLKVYDGKKFLGIVTMDDISAEF